jgi:hypothetical protein
VARTRALLARTEREPGEAEAGLCERAPGFVDVGCLFVHLLESVVGALRVREVVAGEGEVVQQTGERAQEPAPAAPVGLREVEVGRVELPDPRGSGGVDVKAAHQVRFLGQVGDHGGNGVDGGHGGQVAAMLENLLEEHRVQAQQAARLAVGADFGGELVLVVDLAPRAWVRGWHVQVVPDVYMRAVYKTRAGGGCCIARK